MKTSAPADNYVTQFPISSSVIGAIIGVIGFVGLIVPEILLSGVALVWAAQGLFHLSAIPTGIVAAIIAVPALWASFFVVKAAVKVEFSGIRKA